MTKCVLRLALGAISGRKLSFTPDEYKALGIVDPNKSGMAEVKIAAEDIIYRVLTGEEIVPDSF